MATSPLTAASSLVTFDLKINGSPIKDEYQVYSVEINQRVNEIPGAVVRILVPADDDADQPFGISEADDFVPGNEVQINLGYESKNSTVFSGIIIRHGLKMAPATGSELILHCQDKAVKMTVAPQVAAFQEQTDSEICGSLIENHGLVKAVSSTSYRYAQMLQSGSTDWDFLVARAEANGMIVHADAGKVFVQPPQVSGSPVLEISSDMDVFAFDAEIDAGHQLAAVTAAGWDPATAKFVDAPSTEPYVTNQGNLSGKKLSEVLATGDVAVQFTTPRAAEELQGLSDGALLRSRLAAIRGNVSFMGSALPRLNTLITLSNFGARFDGDALVSGVRHVVQEGTWRTEVTFGLPPEFFDKKPQHPGSSTGLLPVVNGLQNGLVKQIERDPDGEHRILVTLPVFGTDVWARQAGLYATRGKGSFFLPEVEDEVIVGFLNDDPRFAVILGSVYSSRNAPPYAADQENAFKAIVSKNDLKLEFNDEDRVLTLATPGKNSVVISDKEKSIVLQDQNGNRVEMNSSGITLKSAKDITIDAGGKVMLKASQHIDLSAAGGDVVLNGLNVTGNAQLGISMKGGATAELSAGAETTVKGAIVMIN